MDQGSGGQDGRWRLLPCLRYRPALSYLFGRHDLSAAVEDDGSGCQMAGHDGTCRDGVTDLAVGMTTQGSAMIVLTWVEPLM